MQTTLLTRLDARNEVAAAALAGHLVGLAQSVPAKPGCLGYAVYQTEETPTTS